MGGVVSSMAADRRDYRQLQKNTRNNLSVDTFLDPNRPVTPAQNRSPACIVWSVEIEQERIFYRADEPNILFDSAQFEEMDQDDLEEDYELEDVLSEEPGASQPAPSPRESQQPEAPEWKLESQDRLHERNISSANSYCETVAWTGES